MNEVENYQVRGILLRNFLHTFYYLLAQSRISKFHAIMHRNSYVASNACICISKNKLTLLVLVSL